MIVGLSEFLRRASEDSHRSQVTLAEEVEYLQRYLDIQKVRFGERLQVSVDIPAELLQAQVPNLLLQPLVENAIKHGIAKRVAGGAIRVAGARRNGNLYLSVLQRWPELAGRLAGDAYWHRHRQSAHPFANPARERIRVAAARRRYRGSRSIGDSASQESMNGVPGQAAGINNGPGG